MRQVQVNRDFLNLPNGFSYRNGDKPTLTDDEFSKIPSEAFVVGIVTDLGLFVDPAAAAAAAAAAVQSASVAQTASVASQVASVAAQASAAAAQASVGNRALDASVVHLAGSEAITGVKTFGPGTLKDKGSMVYLLDAFAGVDNTGATDSTTGMQACFATAPQGSRIVASAGALYTIDGTITPPANNVVVDFCRSGIQAGTVRTGQNLTGNILFNFQSLSDFQFLNANFLPALSPSSGTTTGNTIRSNSTNNCLIDGCTFNQGGINTQGDVRLTVNNNHFIHGGAGGFGGQYVTFSNNYVSNDPAYDVYDAFNMVGYEGLPSVCTTYKHNVIIGSGRCGIEDYSPNGPAINVGARIIGNIIINCADQAVSAVGAAPYIAFNDIVNAGWAIEASGFGARVVHNRCSWDTPTGVEGISINSSSPPYAVTTSAQVSLPATSIPLTSEVGSGSGILSIAGEAIQFTSNSGSALTGLKGGGSGGLPAPAAPALTSAGAIVQTLPDSGPNNNTLSSFSNVFSLTAGGFGSAINMTGVAGGLTTATEIPFSGTQAFTVEAKIRSSVLNVAEALVGKWGTTAGNSNYVLYFTYGQPYFYYVDSTNTIQQIHNTGNIYVIEDGVLHHVAASYDGTTMRLLWDGLMIASAPCAGLATPDSITPTTIGNISDGTVPFNGLVDEVRFSNIARYTGSYSVPTSAFTSDSHTLGLYHFETSATSTPGQLVAGKYYSYRITECNALGETLASNAQGIMLPVGFSEITVTGVLTNPANHLKIYGRTGYQEQLIATLAAGVLTYTDTGAISPNGAMPTSNTTIVPTIVASGTTGYLTGQHQGAIVANNECMNMGNGISIQGQPSLSPVIITGNIITDCGTGIDMSANNATGYVFAMCTNNVINYTMPSLINVTYGIHVRPNCVVANNIIAYAKNTFQSSPFQVYDIPLQFSLNYQATTLQAVVRDNIIDGGGRTDGYIFCTALYSPGGMISLVGNSFTNGAQMLMGSGISKLWGDIRGNSGPITYGSTANFTVGAALGTSPPAPGPFIALTGNGDSGGALAFGTGSTPSAGIIMTVNFSGPYEAIPMVVVCPANAAATTLGLYVSAITTNGFTVSCATAPQPGENSLFYEFNYIVSRLQ